MSHDESAEQLRLLAIAIGAGDTEAEQRLAAQLRSGLLLMLRRRLRDASRAEDVAQEVLLALIRNLRDGRLREPARIVSYVWAIAANLARHEQRERPHESVAEDELLALPDPTPASDAALLDEERLALARSALATLPPRDREILHGLYWEGRDKRSLCVLYGLTPAQFDVVKSRALARLRRACSERDSRARSEGLASLPDRAGS